MVPYPAWTHNLNCCIVTLKNYHRKWRKYFGNFTGGSKCNFDKTWYAHCLSHCIQPNLVTMPMCFVKFSVSFVDCLILSYLFIHLLSCNCFSEKYCSIQLCSKFLFGLQIYFHIQRTEYSCNCIYHSLTGTITCLKSNISNKY